MKTVHEVVSVTPERGDAGRFVTRFGKPAAAVLVLLCGLTLLLGFINKDRCTGPAFDQWGRTQPDYDERNKQEVCYSDIQHLWIGRDIDRHVFPYVDGGINDKGILVGGSVEYPVLTGLLIWAGAIFAHNDAEYLLFSSLLMAPFGLLTGWMLGKLARWRALLWAIGPPLVLYASTTGTCRSCCARWPRSTWCTAGTGRSSREPPSRRCCSGSGSRSRSTRRSSCCR